MTNREKFKEVFGFYPDMVSCVVPRKTCAINKDYDCDKCPFDGWWYKEYKACFELKEEYE